MHLQHGLHRQAEVVRPVVGYDHNRSNMPACGTAALQDAAAAVEWACSRIEFSSCGPR